MQTKGLGRIEVEVADHDGHALGEEVVVLLSENKASFGNQYRFKSKTGEAVVGELPPGPYNLQALAKDYHVGREFVEIHPDRTHKTTLRLKKGPAHATLPVAERLEKTYGIKVAAESLQSLTVADGRDISLDYRQYPDPAHVQVLSPKSLKDLKRWVGSPEGIFVGDHPRFGPRPSIQDIGAGTATLSKGQQSILNVIAREYIYGNAQSVPSSDLAILEGQLRARMVFVPIFFYQNVVIENGATLEIGNGSSVFVCNTLTIHPRGTLKAVGEVRADINLLQQL